MSAHQARTSVVAEAWQQEAPATSDEMEAQQREWAAQVLTEDDAEPWQLRRIGGLDVHCINGDVGDKGVACLVVLSWAEDVHWINDGVGDRGVACLAVLSWPELDVIATYCHAFQTQVPYQPGFLGFREVPAYLEVWEAAKAAGHEPDLTLVDGFGVCHPRRCGSATQFGVAAGTRTIGVAKTLNNVPAMTDRRVKDAMEAQGALELPLQTATGDVVAVAVRKDAEHRQPVFASIGHRTALHTAADIVRVCCKYRVPEPVRVADIVSRQHATAPAAAAVATA